MFADVPDEERRRVLVLNPCELFGLDPEKELTPPPKPTEKPPSQPIIFKQFKFMQLEIKLDTKRTLHK